MDIAVNEKRNLILTGSLDKTAKLWSLDNGQPVQEYRVPVADSTHEGKIFAVALSPDATLVAVGGFDAGVYESGEMAVYVFDAASGELLQRLGGMERTISHLEFSHDGKHLAAGNGYSSKPEERAGGVHVWETKTWRKIYSSGSFSDEVNHIAFLKDGRLFYSYGNPRSVSGKIAEWSPELNQVENRANINARLKGYHLANAQQVTRFSLDPAGTKLVMALVRGNRLEKIRINSDCNCFDDRFLQSINPDRSLKDVVYGNDLDLFREVTFDADGKYVAAGGGFFTEANGVNTYGIQVWDEHNTDNARFVPVSKRQIVRLLPRKEGGFYFSTPKSFGIITHTGKRQSSSLQSQKFAVREFSKDSQVYFPYALAGSNLTATDDLTAIRFRPNKPDGTFDPNGDIIQFDFKRMALRYVDAVDASGFSWAYQYKEGFDIEHWRQKTSRQRERVFPQTLNGIELEIPPGWYTRSLSIVKQAKGLGEPAFAFGTSQGILTYGSDGSLLNNIPTSSTVHAIQFSDDGDRILAALIDGTFRIYDSGGAELLVLFVNKQTLEWVAWTPSGFFTASEKGADLFGWHVNQGKVTRPVFLPASRFYEEFYRPDLLKALAFTKRAGLLEELRRLARTKSIAALSEGGLPPLVRDIRSVQGDRVNEDRISIKASVKLRSGRVGRIEVRVNGATQSVLSDYHGQDGESLPLELSIFVTPGVNSIELVAYNEQNLIASNPAVLSVTSNATPLENPTLHILAVGVNEYKDDRLRLNYAVNDANSIAENLRAAAEKTYGTVEVYTVLDADVTREYLSGVFEELGKAIKPEDVFVFYVSGHGVTLDGEYFFLPQDIELPKDIGTGGKAVIEKTGIGFRTWQRWFAQIKAQKSVLFYDTCESEAAARFDDQDLRLKMTADRLIRATGKAVVAAATGVSPALEGYGGHGVFTYVLLEGIGAGDRDKDGQLEVTELSDYVEKELPVVSYKAFRRKQFPYSSIVGSSFSLGAPSFQAK